MYREAIALTLHRHRPEAEVMLGSGDVRAGETESFEPHMLLHDDTDEVASEALLKDVVCYVEVLYTGSMGIRVTADGRTREIENASMNDLLALVDETERLVSG